MYHTTQAYQCVFNQFRAAWEELVRDGHELKGFLNPVWAARRTEVVDKVAEHATIPTRPTQKDLIQMAMFPWRGAPSHTKDDGILQMGHLQIRKICKDWMLQNVCVGSGSESSPS